MRPLDNLERLTSDAAFAHLCGGGPLNASSGKSKRVKVNPGGNRDASHSLWRILFTV